MLFLFLSPLVLAVVAMFVITVRTGPDGRAVVVRRRPRRSEAAAPPVPSPAVSAPRRRPESLGRRPEGLGRRPESLGRRPEGLGRRPEGLGRRPESLEGMFATLLIAGEISRSQYRRAAEELAAQDEVGHPLAVPPDPGPAGA